MLLISAGKPAQSRAGFSFGNRTNGLWLVALVIGLKRNGVIQRFSARLPRPYIVAAAARAVQKSGIALRSAMYLQTLSEESRICIQRQITFGGGGRS